MNVETTSADFRRAINLALRVVERRSHIPILSMVRCHANGAFEATGTDLDMSLTAKVARSPGPDADFVMQAPREVSTAIGAGGGDGVTAALADGKLQLSSGALDLSVDTLPVDDFPMDMSRPLDEVFSATLSKADVATIARVAGAMSSEETRYYLNGINLKPIGPTTVRAEATDGHRLYFADIELPDAAGAMPPSCIVPRKAVALLIALAGSTSEGIRVAVGYAAPLNRQETTAPERTGLPRLTFALDQRGADVQVCTKLIDGTFPDVARVVPTANDKQVLFKSADLRRAVVAVSGHSRDVRAVRIALNHDGSATLSAAYVGIGLAASVKVDCQHRSGGFEIGFNGGYLASVLASNQGDEILFDLSDPASPALIRNPADTAWTAVLMPLRL